MQEKAPLPSEPQPRTLAASLLARGVQVAPQTNVTAGAWAFRSGNQKCTSQAPPPPPPPYSHAFLSLSQGKTVTCKASHVPSHNRLVAEYPSKGKLWLKVNGKYCTGGTEIQCGASRPGASETFVWKCISACGRARKELGAAAEEEGALKMAGAGWL